MQQRHCQVKPHPVSYPVSYTDGQTDRQTSHDDIGRAWIASRGKKRKSSNCLDSTNKDVLMLGMWSAWSSEAKLSEKKPRHTCSTSIKYFDESLFSEYVG